MTRNIVVSVLLVLTLLGGCAVADETVRSRVGRTTYNVEDVNAVRSRLFQRYGVWPRRYYSLFDGSNDAERALVAALPQVAQLIRERAAALGQDFEIQPAELATNFITEGGYYVLVDNMTTDIDGFQHLGIDTLVDNYEALKPWLHESVRSAVEAGSRTGTYTNEQGKVVHTLNQLTLEEGLYANAGMFAWSKAQVAKDMAAKGIVLKSLEPAVQFFWTTVYYNAGSGKGLRFLNDEGVDWHKKKWTAADDFHRYCMVAHYNGLWRTATFEGLRQIVFSSSSGGAGTGGGGHGGTAQFPLTGAECGEIDYYGACSGSLLRYCADEQLQEIQCGTPCGWRDEDIGFDCQPAEGAGCGRVTALGRCEGSVLDYCGSDGVTLVTIDCAAEGAACSWRDDEIGYDCVAPDLPSDCGGVDFYGKCEGSTLVFCGASGLESIDCSARGETCGWQDDWIGYNCLTGGGSCGAVTAQGECDGAVLRYCTGGGLVTVDCAAEGGSCGWRDVTIGYDCIGGEGVPSPEGCGDIDYVGRCDGDVLSYCGGSELVTVDCAAMGAACGWHSEAVGYDCLAAGGGPTCGSVTSQGECRGDLLVYCDGAEGLREVDCAAQGMACAWQDDWIGYNCMPPSAPVCRDGEFQCTDGRCIPESYICDLYPDCAGGEDEAGCLPDPGCGADQFECNDGTCIPWGYLCDGVVDCPWGDDEEGCAPACGADQYTCNDGSCIPLSYICDGEDDCPSGEDEWYCV